MLDVRGQHVLAPSYLMRLYVLKKELNLNYSFRNVSTGLAFAAFMVCDNIVIKPSASRSNKLTTISNAPIGNL